MVKYIPGDVVWVKVTRCPWWPAEVLDPKLCPLPNKNAQRSFIAFVKFFNEEEYQVVTCESNIMPFRCPRMLELIKKGQNERRSSLSNRFQPAVAMAEQKLSNYSPATLSRCSSSVSAYDPNLDEESSCSDSELPEGLTIPDANMMAIHENDAVWAKYRKFPYWPAVVQRVKKEKRLALSFLGQNSDTKKRFFMHFGKHNILPFSHSKRKEFEEMGETLNEPLRSQFQNAVREAEVYINKKALQCFGDEKVENDSGTSFNNTIESEPETPRPSDGDAPPVKKRRLSAPACNNKSSKQDEMESRKKKLKARNKRIVDFILSSEMQKYLLQIYNKEKKSDLHQKYQTSQGERNRLRHAGYGPIENEEQQDEITFKLVEWMREITGTTIVDLSYILDVWVPEAVVYALIKVKQYSRSRAWKVFWKGYKMTKAECKEIHNHLTHLTDGATSMSK